MKTKIIKGDLILKKDIIIKSNLIVEGNIKGDFDLKVLGNLTCRDLNCGNLNCLNLNCWNLDCWNIVLCEKLTRKSKDTKIKCRMLIENRNKLEQREW